MGDPLQTRGGRGGDGALANQHAGKDGGSLMSHSGKVDGTAACAACGFANPAGFEFCGSCGADSGREPAAAIPAGRRRTPADHGAVLRPRRIHVACEQPGARGAARRDPRVPGGVRRGGAAVRRHDLALHGRRDPRSLRLPARPRGRCRARRPCRPEHGPGGRQAAAAGGGGRAAGGAGGNSDRTRRRGRPHRRRLRRGGSHPRRDAEPRGPAARLGAAGQRGHRVQHACAPRRALPLRGPRVADDQGLRRADPASGR